jgi:hypothetical protein
MTTQFVYYVCCQYPDSFHDTQASVLTGYRRCKLEHHHQRYGISCLSDTVLPQPIGNLLMMILCALRPCRGGCAIGAPRARDVGGYGIFVRAHGWWYHRALTW